MNGGFLCVVRVCVCENVVRGVEFDGVLCVWVGVSVMCVWCVGEWWKWCDWRLRGDRETRGETRFRIWNLIYMLWLEIMVMVIERYEWWIWFDVCVYCLWLMWIWWWRSARVLILVLRSYDFRARLDLDVYDVCSECVRVMFLFMRLMRWDLRLLMEMFLCRVWMRVMALGSSVRFLACARSVVMKFFELVEILMMMF